MMNLHLTCLGSFQTALDGKPLISFHSVKVQALLAYLTLEADRPHPREALATLLWPLDTETSARNSLRQALYELRKLLGDRDDSPAPFLLVTRQTVQFNRASDHHLDVADFLAYLQQEQLTEAAACYRGELLNGLACDSEPFEEWLRQMRMHLHNQAVDLFAKLTEQKLSEGNLAQARTYAERQLALEPWREEAHRQLMTVLALAGARTAALAHYEICRRILADELGIEPDAETTALYAQIRAGKVRENSMATHHIAVPSFAERMLASPETSALSPDSLATETSRLSSQVDWGEAPDVSRFTGRQAELAELRHWLVDERCRLVAVLGMGGQGKTALATMLATQVEHEFDAVLWRSLRNAPPIEELLDQCLRVFSNHNIQEVPTDVDKRITLLLAYLRQQRCLLVLDNYETILQSERAGHYLPGYEGYGQLLQRVGEGRHQSCLLLSSREKPKEVAPLEGAAAPVRSLHLASLQPTDGRALLQDRGLSGSDSAWTTLHIRYSGHPLALMIVAETIRELFAGEIGEFLSEETALFGDISDLLARQIGRLSRLEQELMFWLAVEREGVNADELRANLLQSPPKLAVLEALRSLRQRSLVERTETGFTLQNVVLEYLTTQLIERVYEELTSGQLALFSRYALLKAQAKSYVRESQRRLILMPLANRLVEPLGKARAVEQLTAVLAQLRHDQSHQSSYAGGNLFNLLVQINGDLRGFDFSHLAVWQADLRRVEAQAVNFQQADLSHTIFRDTFGGILEIAFSPNGEHIAAATLNGEVRIWRVQNGEPLLTCMANKSRLRSLCFSPDGLMVASGGDEGIVRLWEVASGRCLAILSGHTNDVNCVRFSPDGTLLASGSNDLTVRLWDVVTTLNANSNNGYCRAILQSHTGHVNAVCFNPTGTLLATGGNDLTVCLWDIAITRSDTDNSHACLRTLHGHTYEVNALCFSPDGNLLASGSTDQTIRLWTVAAALDPTGDSNPCRQILGGHTGAVHSICFNAAGTLFASGSWDHTIRLWNPQDWQCLATLESNGLDITSICFNPDGSMLAGGSWDLTISLWEVQSQKRVTTLQGYTDEVWSVCFSPDGRLLASGSWDQLARIWDVSAALHPDPLNRPCRAELRGHTHFIVSVCFSPDGRLLATASWDQTIRLWDVSTALNTSLASGRCVATLDGNLGQHMRVCFSPDGTLLASGGFDHALRLWDVHRQTLRTVLRGHSGQIDSICFHPAGKFIVTCGHDQTVRLWDVHSGQGRTILQELTAQTFVVCFSPDGTLLATGSRDTLVRLWALDSGQCVATLQGHSADVKSLCFSPDGRLLASGSVDHTVRLWEVQSRRCHATLHGHTDALQSISFHPDGKLLATGSPDGAIKFWDVERGECLQTVYSDRPYARMNITSVTGVSEAQKMTLKILGAMEEA